MQKLRQCLLYLVLLLAAALPANAQRAISGRVTDAADGEPLPGVNVVVQGTTVGTATDVDGTYQLQVPSGADSLSFSYVGYVTQTVAIGDRTTIDVGLESAVYEGNEVVVVGYTTERRRAITGAVSLVTPEELTIRKVATMEEALKGRIPGVVVNSTGEPGRGAQIIVRGLNFVGEGTNSPLYVVDGLYMRENPNLDPNDIASIQVLKDASAAAQYGAQAANGVIVITTKRGQTMTGNRINFTSYVGMQEIPKKVGMMDVNQWAALNKQAYANAGLPPMEGAVSPKFNTDWQDALFQRGAIQNYNLSITGGSQNATYLVSGGYTNQMGAIIETGFDRYNLRVNSELKKGILTLGETAAFSRSNRQALIGFPLIDAVRMLPSIPVYDPNNIGGYGYGTPANNTFGTNPIGMQERETNDNISNQVLGTVYSELGLIKRLRYRFNFGFQFEDFTNSNFIRRAFIRQNNPDERARLWQTGDNRSSLLFENLLTFDNTVGRHNINAVAGYTEQTENYEHLAAYREGYSDETLQVINAGTMNLNNNGYEVENTLRSFLARVNYGYADRYLLTASIRRDGSSRFGPDNRWGTFYSGSVGWVLSEEPFFESLPVLGSYVNNFKLRASYGTLGNQDIPDYAYAAAIRQNMSYVLGPDAIASGAIQLNLANPNIRWQDNSMTNFGVDLSLLNYRFQILADYYISTSDNLLVAAPIPWSLGAGGVPYVNAGSIRNRGFELGATYRYMGHDFQLNSTLNLTTIKNEVLSLANNNQPVFAGPFGVTRTAVGGPIGAYYVLKTDGIFQSDAEVQAHKSSQGKVIQPNAKPGDIRFADLNDDGLISDLDRYNAGSGFPDLEAGFFLDGKVRNVDFGLSFRSAIGAKIFSVPKFWTDRLDDNSNYRRDIQPWSPENPSSDTPRAVYGTQGAANATAVSDRWIENGDYLRIQNVVLGYTFPARFTQNLGLPNSGLRLYVNLQNLYTFSKYTFWDPENVGMGILARGVDDGQIFPNVRTYTIGLDLNF